jgi:glyoxylase-like metal-dependent hydrolase (beta-lactamase superfamily II)
MKLHTINTEFFKLDGGAMFGVVPKSIWNRINPSDEKNLCTWSMRCLLVELNYRLILIDCGLGNKQDEKFFSYYEPSGDDNLERSLNRAGFKAEDITDVFLTHLHFDHCGGAIIRDKENNLVPAFKNANYWSNVSHWEWATKPNSRERASFLKENILPIQQSGQLRFVEDDGKELFPGFKVKFVYGHTEAMMLPILDYNGKTVVYCADLIPSVGHIPLSYVMAYDVRPLVTLEEKETFLKEALEKNYILYFEHDPKNEACTVISTERGIRLKEILRLSEV